MTYYCTQCGIEMPTNTGRCLPCFSTANDMLAMHDAAAKTAAPSSPFAAVVEQDSTAPPVAAEEAMHPMPSFWTALRHPAMRGKILKAGSLALAKSLFMSGLVLVPGMFLTLVAPVAGIIWMFVGSFAMMVRTYARPWRLSWFTILLPAVTAGLLLLIQLMVFRNHLPTSLLLAVGGVGLLIGAVRARTHAIYLEAGQVMAKRTAGYLVVWAVCFGTTQLLGMFGRTLPLVRGSLLGSVMTTAMVICVSLVILSRFGNVRRPAMN